MKALFDIIQNEILNMTDTEFDTAIEQARCGDLRWSLEYAWNPELCKYLQWRICYRYMWE